MTARPDSLLWLRAGMVSALTFLVGAVGHVSAGGLMPSWIPLVAMLAIGTTICASVLATEVSAGRIIALVVLGQIACHSLLSLSAGHAGDAPVAVRDPGHGSLPVTEGGRVGSLQDYYDSTVGTSSAGSALTVPDPAAMLQHLPMFLLHALVAVVVGLWLVAGERALWSLLTLVVASAVVLIAPVTVPVAIRRAMPVRRRPAAVPSLARVTRSVVRRGPPALLAV